ncbi:SDR family NAD(P)-dependent oxidoreductase [Arenibacterium halophilum]|uniref:SDR family oxidoreductase n=1 Tax=Arenibacterium halophilum TaxID=2583821 RepID=A0ABY2XET1_9RHOB|nr:SDR family NAD(P)-dependent oxidoreductase [Arenibacterium halophilum]TMV15532.1 SDR family oxidoreductase [Arenibacterium halophilum]
MDKRVVIVTGAGIGIGKSVAERFAGQGDHVVVTDVLEAEGKAVTEAITAAGGSAEFHALNVRDTAAADALVGDVIDRFGRIDVIVANAGIAHRVPMSEMTDEKWDETFDVDLKGMLRVIRPALPAMKAGGSIICLSSIMGVAYGWDEHVHYSSAKAGVVGLVRGLAVEVAKRGIRVNGIAPGYIRTAQLLSEKNSLGPNAAEIASPYIPMGRLGEPEEIASVIGFLASADASYLTGQVVTVDGGLLPGRY